MFRTETGVGKTANGADVIDWDVKGWIGTDDDKLWLKTEGTLQEQRQESAEYWALYSRNVDVFWDAQAGIRYDAAPHVTPYLTLGVAGLAPYDLETEAHVFVSNRGDVSLRLRQEKDLLLTQQWILQPYLEVQAFAQAVERQDVGAGLAEASLGLQIRYAYTPRFAPYIDFHDGQKFGETALIANRKGENSNEFGANIGLRLMF